MRTDVEQVVGRKQPPNPHDKCFKPSQVQCHSCCFGQVVGAPSISPIYREEIHSTVAIMLSSCRAVTLLRCRCRSLAVALSCCRAVELSRCRAVALSLSWLPCPGVMHGVAL